VSKVPDFYVSIPTALGEGGAGWTYDVVADPKNQLMDVPSKTIDEDQVDLVVGSDVTWTLNVPIPTLNNNETFTEAVITDTLDSRLTYVAASSSVTFDSDPATSLVEGTHYNVTGNAVWTLTESGRALLDSNQGKNLIIEFDTTVTSVGDGSIPNDDYGSKFNGTTVPGDDEPHTYWGQLSILKTDDSESALPLAGAEFQVFPAAGTQCPATVPTGDPVATGVSGDDGIVLWDYMAPASSPLGLWIANSDEPLTSPTKDYCVYETVVPSGHSAGVITNPVTITAGEDNVKALTVVNPKTDGPDLPLTGAQGTLLMTVGGLVLVGVGGGALALTRRRKTE
ncbi:MAG: SpaH/EbpB family LPXTG-anchored major pilin, partial [Flaviflexus sp.]|uniref:SpaH/EbpB family LPXTG-anchored major pilin n=1 Tax=Flaviflexus sp. TaxID=1969482 RepID=UPI00352D7C80